MRRRPRSRGARGRPWRGGPRSSSRGRRCGSRRTGRPARPRRPRTGGGRPGPASPPTGRAQGPPDRSCRPCRRPSVSRARCRARRRRAPRGCSGGRRAGRSRSPAGVPSGSRSAGSTAGCRTTRRGPAHVRAVEREDQVVVGLDGRDVVVGHPEDLAGGTLEDDGGRGPHPQVAQGERTGAEGVGNRRDLRADRFRGDRLARPGCGSVVGEQRSAGRADPVDRGRPRRRQDDGAAGPLPRGGARAGVRHGNASALAQDDAPEPAVAQGDPGDRPLLRVEERGRPDRERRLPQDGQAQGRTGGCGLAQRARLEHPVDRPAARWRHDEGEGARRPQRAGRNRLPGVADPALEAHGAAEPGAGRRTAEGDPVALVDHAVRHAEGHRDGGARRRRCDQTQNARDQQGQHPPEHGERIAPQRPRRQCRAVGQAERIRPRGSGRSSAPRCPP